MTDTVFDGRWTDSYEWKQTSLTNIFSEEEIRIRTAHYENFLYIMIDYISDNSININSDRAIICFDSQNKKSNIPTKDDFCFQATMSSSNGIMLQGGSTNAVNGFFQKIESLFDEK